MINEEENYILKRLSLYADMLLQSVKMSPQDMPTEFSGPVSELLYNERVSNQGLILFIDRLSLDIKGHSDDEIIERFQLISRLLKSLISDHK
jgi:hypothetical protein